MEAIREFNKILLYIYKTKQYHQKSPQYEQILKKNEQMYALLAISLSLCPQVKLVEETVNSQLREKYGEKMIRMQRYDDEAFAIYDELFSYACPKFITPSPPSFEEPLVNYNQVCRANKANGNTQCLKYFQFGKQQVYEMVLWKSASRTV